MKQNITTACVIISSTMDVSLHLAVYVGATAGEIQEDGQHSRFNYNFVFKYFPLLLPCLPSFFLPQKGSSGPLPSSTGESNLERVRDSRFPALSMI